jgi:hypothetical protein
MPTLSQFRFPKKGCDFWFLHIREETVSHPGGRRPAGAPDPPSGSILRNLPAKSTLSFYP